MMSLTRRIAEGTAIYTIGNFLNNFLGFLTVLFLIKALGKFEYGLLTLAISAFTIATILLDLGSLVLIPSEIARYRRIHPEIAKSIINEFTILQILLGTAISSALFIGSFLIGDNYNKQIINLMWIISIMVIIKAIDNIFSVTFYGFTKFKLHQGKEIVNGITKCLLASLVLYLGGDVFTAISIYPISMLISVLVFSPYFLSIVKTLPSNDKAKGIILKIYKEHGKFVLANVPLKRAHSEMPIWIIQYILGVESVAVYSVASKVVSFLSGILMPLNKVLFPVFSEISTIYKDKMRTVAARGLKYTGIVSFTIFIISFISVPYIFKLMFKEYLESIILIRILLLTLFFFPIFNVVTPYLYAIRGQKYIFSTLLYSFLIYCWIFYMLTYLFGLIGAVLSRVLNSMTVAMLQYRFLLKLEPNMCISWREIFNIDEYDRKLYQNICKRFKRKFY